MADFVAVLRKTIDGLGETTPEMRRRVYEKARATVAAKLAALNPTPPAAVAERQKKTLEDAIAEIEASFPPPSPRAADPSDPLAELENVFASLRATPRPLSPPSAPAATLPRATPAALPPHAAPTPAPPRATATPTAPPPRAAPAATYVEPKPWPVTTPKPAADAPMTDIVPVARRETPPPPTAEDFDAIGISSADEPAFHAQHEAQDEPEEMPRSRRGLGGLIAAAIALVVLAGSGYAIWLNKQDLAAMLGIGGEEVAAAPPAEPAGAPAVGTLPPKETSGTAAQQAPDEPETPKFTQRLNADGSEIDVGPAGGEPGIGEGTSVASATTPPAAGQVPAVPAATPPASDLPADQTTAATTAAAADGTAPAPDTAQPAPPSGTAPASTPAAAQVAVGQKAIFYEERTSSAQGSAESGQVVWSVVQESPGNDLPPEPAIRGEATIPGKDLQLRMTIRRNADQTLPASHIIELIFLTPEGFGGGGIDNILRFALKGTEEAAGSPLIGIPAKIADGFFLVALNDSKAETEANLTLLRRETWIDVPVIYKSGRRALITLEKGIPGDRVFDEALKAWQAASAG